MGPRKEKVETALQSTLLLGSCEPTDTMVLEEAVVDRVAIWSLWHTPMGKSQRRLLGFCAKPYHPLWKTPLFENQLLPCHWALVETECLTMCHHATWSPIMKCMLSNPHSIKSGVNSDTPSRNGRGICVMGFTQPPKAQISYLKK